MTEQQVFVSAAAELPKVHIPRTGLSTLMLELTPAQVAGLKLAKNGDLYPQSPTKWTHKDATVTFAKTDRWKERPLKIKFVTNKTIEDLSGPGLLERRHLDDDAAKDVYGITMAGKMWLLKNK